MRIHMPHRQLFNNYLMCFCFAWIRSIKLPEAIRKHHVNEKCCCRYEAQSESLDDFQAYGREADLCWGVRYTLAEFEQSPSDKPPPSNIVRVIAMVVRGVISRVHFTREPICNFSREHSEIEKHRTY